MKIAVLSDIHGNLEALEAVSADLDRLLLRHLPWPALQDRTRDRRRGRDRAAVRHPATRNCRTEHGPGLALRHAPGNDVAH